MRKYVLLILSLYLLVACSALTDSQSLETAALPTVTNTPEPTLTPTYLPLTPVSVNTPIPETSGVITADNVDRLTLIATWGDGNVYGVEYTPDGEWLIVASSIGIFIYETADYSLIKLIKTAYEIGDIAVAPNNEYLTVGTGSQLEVYSLPDFYKLQTIDIRAASFSFSPDSSLLAVGTVGSLGPELQLWEMETGELIQSFDSYGTLGDIEFSPSGEFVVGAGEGTYVWSVDGHFIERQHNFVNGGATYDLVFTPDGSYLLEGSDDNSIHIWSVAPSGELTNVRNIYSTAIGVQSIEVSPDGSSLVGFTHIGMYIWDIDSGEIVHTLGTDLVGSRLLDWSLDGQEIVSVSFDKGIEIWDVNTGTLLKDLPDNIDSNYFESWDLDEGVEVADLTISSDGKLAAYSTLLEESIFIRNIATGESLQTLNFLDTSGTSYLSSFSFSPDDTLIAGYYVQEGKQEGLKVWEVDNGALLYEIDFEGTERKGQIPYHFDPLGWSKNADLLAIGFPDGYIRIYHADNGEFVKELLGHKFWANNVAFTADGLNLVSSSVDGVMRIWGFWN